MYFESKTIIIIPTELKENVGTIIKFGIRGEGTWARLKSKAIENLGSNMGKDIYRALPQR